MCRERSEEMPLGGAKLSEGYIPVIKRETVETTVDSYLPNIARMLEEAHKLGVAIPNTSIHQEIQKLGYRGSLRWMCRERSEEILLG